MYKRPRTSSKEPAQQQAKTVTLPAPTMGLNQRDPLSAMESMYAINLTNFIASPQGCSVREGYRVRNTGLPGYVNTLATWTPTSGPSKIFAWSNTSVYDVTNSGAVGAAVVTGLTTPHWNTVNFNTAGNQYLVCSNGVDPTRHYTAAGWTTWTNVGSPTLPGEIGGPGVSTLNHPIVHQRRLWFVQENSASAWYLPVNSLGGPASSLNYGAVFPRGGKLVQLASWSFDGGEGIRNFLVAVSSNGDLVIFEGTDPSSATDWQISATWRLAAPANNNCFFNMGGELLYMSVEGLMPLSEYMQNSQTAVALSDSIRSTFATLAETQGGITGWDMHMVHSKNLLIVNVPQIDPLRNVQLVYNSITKGWSLFTGWPAQSWTNLGTSHYFGGFGQVCQAFSGYKDGAASDGSGGTIYTATGQQAFNYLDDRIGNKHFTMARVNLTTSSSSPNIIIAANADFSTTPPSNIGAAVPVIASLWNTAVWNNGVWAAGPTNYNAWQSIAAAGYCVSVTLAISVLSPTTWIATDVVYERGGVFT